MCGVRSWFVLPLRRVHENCNRFQIRYRSERVADRCRFEFESQQNNDDDVVTMVSHLAGGGVPSSRQSMVTGTRVETKMAACTDRPYSRTNFLHSTVSMVCGFLDTRLFRDYLSLFLPTRHLHETIWFTVTT